MTKIVRDDDGNVYNMIEGDYIRQIPASIWWFLLPVLVGFIGGIIMCASKKERQT